MFFIYRACCISLLHHRTMGFLMGSVKRNPCAL
uniref:Uncharacterized protein n=1 Tax=Arundo donax TaxID=35708 RepID=A0A0A9AH96_ARUDO